MPTSEVPVVRFAPSPTGWLHVGGARTVLFNWLFARRTGGRFLLRVEDTDTERNRPELVDAIYDSIRWLGLDWDGEPVHQSDRFDAYREAARQLADAGHAYWCACSAEQVQARAKERGGPPGYDGFCRDRGLGPGEGRALRFRTPDEGTTSFDDVVRGRVEFENRTLEDLVVLRSNGTPTFILANVVDDAWMGITHVIRGEEHVNGTPKYLLIGDALGLGYRPVFAHLPVLVDEQRRKLSKRRDDVAVSDYRAAGYLPEAMVNYLALLGWGPPDGVEIRPLAEIVELFRLEDVTPSPAFFDVRKLQHVNGEYIRGLAVDDFVARAATFLPPGERPRQALQAMAPLVQERVRTLAEVPELIDFLWLDEPALDAAAWDKAMVRGKGAREVLDATLAGLERLGDDGWSAGTVRAVLEAAAVDAGLVGAEGKPQLAKAQAPVRVAVTGRAVGPPLFEAIEVLGRDATLGRLRAARARLG
ncbi:MAG: glutamate--tRNA ligase [Actinobacteria bacterium]|nr:glutamate--tRNA ligase [Actinomycetota bacterium]